MDSSFFLTTVAAAIGIFTLFRKLRFDQDSKEKDSSLTPSSAPPSSLTPSSVPPPSLPHIWRHDVFPSFRGEDVRRDFLSHFLAEFQRMAITPFIDNEIRRGESIGTELIRAIQESKIAVILISENYASSKWCLDELVEYMKCRDDELGQTVIPIFYEVDPSDVKKLTGHFGEVFKKTCAGKTKEVTKRWKQALAKVATIAGYHSDKWDNEATMIKEIATDIQKKLNSYILSSDFDGLVGMRAHLEKLEPLLCLDSDEVRMIGIWGPPGIGKTTIARVAYCQIFSCFQLSVFMDNIKANCPRPRSDDYSAKLQLQQQFMSQITNQKNMEIPHLGVVQDRLKDKKVLVVLDGVDHLVQLDAMAKETWWFGPGSRIIITTQDRKLFRAQGIKQIYKVDLPSTNEALQIFCVSAFGQKSPKDGFEELARKVTKLAGELPLGLRVMGSYFRGMSKGEWTKSLPRLETSLDGDIQSILKFSYDALDDEDKDLFLHIACFFNNYLMKNVEEHLRKKFLEVGQRLKVLADKSLISIHLVSNSLESLIKMHSLFVKLGREIVRKQSIQKPGHRQFLVDGREICAVLSGDAIGSESVIGIDFICNRVELFIKERAFEGMSDLKFLKISGLKESLYLLQALNYLSPKLQLLDWSEFPMTCLPSTMNVEFLVELNMRNSKLENLWEGTKRLLNLKKMILNGSKNLKMLPDLSTATNLEKLDLYNCSSLRKLPSTIGNATNLRELNLGYCSSLLELPFSIENLQKLRELRLQGCSKLDVLPTNINLESLEELDLTNCSMLKSFPDISTKVKNLKLGGTAIEEVPLSIRSWSRLEELLMPNCENLKSITKMYLNDTKIQEVPPISCLRELDLNGYRQLVSLPQFLDSLWGGLKPLQNLENMNLSLCVNLKKLPDFSTAPNLKKLYLNNCWSLRKLPSSIGNATNLEELHISDCSNLSELPSSIGNLQKLEKLILRRCSKLEVLPTNINLRSLYELDLTSCSMMKTFPEISTNIIKLNLKGSAIEEVPLSIRLWSCLDAFHMTYFDNLKEFPHALDRITSLYFINREIQEIPLWVMRFSRLHTLHLKRCRKLVSLSQIPDSVSVIYAEGCHSLERLDMDLSTATQLGRLNLRNCTSLTKLPSSIGNAAYLSELDLSNCSNLVELPFSIGNLEKLRSLILKGCSNLVEFPSSIANATTNLETLDLSHCSSLRKLPAFIWNATNLKELDLGGCLSLVELPLSIGNLQKLHWLVLKGCSKLEVFPTNINLKSLEELDLTDCSMLKSFPEISTNIKKLNLKGTAIEEVPLSIKKWSRLDELYMSYFENLKEFPHALDSVTALHLSDTNIKEVPPFVMSFSRLVALALVGCRQLVSLPQFHDSLLCIFAEGCESLERLDCSFHNPVCHLYFAKCFKLNQEGRDLIIQTKTINYSCLPGREVPSCFTHRATCGDCSMTINLNENPLPRSMRFKACFWMVYKGDDTDWKAGVSMSVKCRKKTCFEDEEILRDHLYIFEREAVVTSNELVFDFSFDKDSDMRDIGEFGLLQLP